MNHKKIDKMVLEDEKWEVEKAYRERELAILEREQANKEAEIELKRNEHAASKWHNPLFVAIMAAAIAIIGNAVLALINGELQRQLEAQKSEQARILEMVKTGEPDKAAENLNFLLKAGLISDPKLFVKLSKFLETRTPGSGPTLPSFSYDKSSYENVSTEWLESSEKPDNSVNAIWIKFTSKTGKEYRAVHVFEHPSGPYILLGSEDKDVNDFEKVQKIISNSYNGKIDGDITDRGDDIVDVIYVNSGFTQKGLSLKVKTFYRNNFDKVSIEYAYY